MRSRNVRTMGVLGLLLAACPLSVFFLPWRLTFSQWFCTVILAPKFVQARNVRISCLHGKCRAKLWSAEMVEQQERQSERVQISVALDEAVRSQLEQAARRSVRSLSGEAAWRIMESLKADEQNAA